MSFEARSVLEGSQKTLQQKDAIYSTVDDREEQASVMTDIPAYVTVLESNHQPIPQDNPAYNPVSGIQEQSLKMSSNPAYDRILKTAESQHDNPTPSVVSRSANSIG